MEKEKKIIRLENILIIAAIGALWPVILHWPARTAIPILYMALVLMTVIARRRWRRLMNPRKDKK